MTVSAAEKTVTGDWSVTSDIMGNIRTSKVVFKQEGETLTGMIAGREKEIPVTGKVVGNIVTWRYEVVREGQTLSLVFGGSLAEDGKISGSVAVEPISVDGTFTATRSSHSQ